MEGSSAVTNKEESGSIDYVYPPGVPVLQDLGLVGSAALHAELYATILYQTNTYRPL